MHGDLWYIELAVLRFVLNEAGCCPVGTPAGVWACATIKWGGGIQVYAQLLGTEQLPWEGDRMTSGNWKKLGIFRHHVLKLLDRDPAKRMTMQQFAVACDSIFDSRSLTARHRAFVTTK